MKKKVLSALLCAAMAGSMLAGCGGSKSDSKEADKSATESTKAASDTFTFAIGGDTGNTLNPITADDRWGLMTCHMVYSPAYYIYQDGTIDWILAESMDASEDGKVYTMKLKEGLKWSDGEPLTADDIVFTFNSINDMKQNLYVGGEPIKVEKVDDTTVTFTLAEPSASVVELLSAETFIVPKHIFEGKGSFDVNMLEDKVVGSGPYMLEEYKTGEHLKFVKNPNYANGEANIDTVVYRIIENSDTAGLALQKQEVDALSVTVDQVDTFEGDDNFTVSKYSEGRVSYLRLNSVAPSMKDKDYREGIFRALNRDEIMTAAFTSEDYYKLGYTFLPYSSSYYTEDGVEKWDQDIDKAKKLTANGAKSLKLCYVEESTEQKNEALTIQAELKAVGIDVELCGVNQAAYMSAAYDPESTDYDMFLGAYVMGIDPDTFAPLFDSTKDDMMNFHNADIDAKFNEAATTLDDSKRKELYSELQVLVSEEALQYPMGTSMKTVVTTARVGGLDDAQFVPIYTFGDVSKLTLK